MIDIDDPEWVEKMMELIKAVSPSDPVHPMDGKLVVSKVNALCTAQVSMANGKAVLNFGWDSPKSRFWPCSVEHLEKHYRLL